MYRNYYSYNDMPKPKTSISARINEPHSDATSKKSAALVENGRLFGRFELDDVIIAAVILVLLLDECEDSLLLVALAFVLFVNN